MEAKDIWKLKFISPFHKDDPTKENTYLALSIFTGISAALVAIALKEITHTLTNFFQTGDSFTLHSWLWGGAAVIVSAILTCKFFPSTSGSGIPHTRVALAVFNGKIPLRETIAKFLTSALSLSSGMSVGREGPTVYIASGIGSFLGEFFHLTKKKVKNLVAMGAAGGIAAAFNAPIAAVTFTLEEIIGDLNAKILGSIIVSSVVASVTALLLQGDQPTFAELHYQLNNIHELWLYFIVGISCAVTGPLWVISVLKMRDLNINIFIGNKVIPIIIAFVVIGLVSHINTDVLGSGHTTIEHVLHARFTDWKFLLILLVLKFALTTICYGSGVSGGLFMPTLMTGALLGGFLGAVFKIYFPETITSIGPYALVGMGAYFAAVIRTPMTSIIMVFEMTRDYKIMLPLMIANMTAFFIAKRILKGSVYENISQQDGIYLPGHDDQEVMDTLLIEDAMVTEVKSLNAKNRVIDVIREVKKSDISGYPVMSNGKLVGMVSRNDICSSFAKKELLKRIEELSEKSVVKIYKDQSLMVAFHRLKKFNISRLPVVSRIDNKHVIGIITAEDIVNKFGFHIQEEQLDLEDVDLEGFDIDDDEEETTSDRTN